MKNTRERTTGTWVAGLPAIVLGLSTVREGGLVLFGPSGHAAAVGNHVPFVLWFNFIAGFFYIMAGACLPRLQPKAMWLALMITLSTLVVFVLLLLYIQDGGAHEQRTLAAMSLRSVAWAGLTLHTFLKFQSSTQAPETL